MAAQAHSEREIYGTQPAGVSGERLQDAVVQALWPTVCQQSSASLVQAHAPDTELAPSAKGIAHAEPLPESRRSLQPWRPSQREVRAIAIYVVPPQPYEPLRERVQRLSAEPEPRRLTSGI